jgi:outer membrane lipoprotein-sorting protein
MRLVRVAIALLAATAAAATAAVSSEPTPTADEIVARHVAARGGLGKIRSVETLRQTGHATTGADRQALVTRELKRPNRTRFEFTVQGITAVFVSDGEHGWRMSPFEGDVDPQALSDEVVQEAADQGDIEGPLVDWRSKGHQVELVGREVVAGRDAHKLKLTLATGDVRYEYLDVKSHRLLRTDSTRQVRGRPVQIQTTFGDYKKTAGVLFPRRIEVEAAGRPQRLLVVVDRIEVNPPLSNARFEMPVPAQP